MSLLKVAEVASVLRVSASTVRRLIDERSLVAMRIGHQLRVDSASLVRYLRASETVGDKVSA